MRRAVFVLLGSLSALSMAVHADDGDSGMSAKDVKTLFFGQDDRTLVADATDSPGTLSVNWKPLVVTCAPLPSFPPSGVNRRTLFADATER